MDLKSLNSRATTYRIEPEKTGRKSLEVGGELYNTIRITIRLVIAAFWDRHLNPKQRRMVERAYRVKTRHLQMCAGGVTHPLEHLSSMWTGLVPNCFRLGCRA